MTQFAKMLVFLNFFLCMLLTGWTIGVFTERVDWAPARTLGGEREIIPGKEGRLAELKKDIPGLVERRELVERRWLDASANLDKAEKHRAKYQVWYADLMELSRSGNNVKGEAQKPINRHLGRNPQTGEFVTTKEDSEALTPKVPFDAPVMRPGIEFDGDKAKEEELQSEAFYQRKMVEVREAIDKQQKQLEGLLAEHNKLTERIAGVARKDAEVGPDGRTRKEKYGLQDERDNQVDYLKNCKDELEYLRPLVNNVRTELILLEKRQAALKARLKELENLAVNR